LRMLASTLAAAHDLPELLDLGKDQAIAAFHCTHCAIDLAESARAGEGELALPLRTPRGKLGLLRLSGIAGQAGGVRGPGAVVADECQAHVRAGRD